MLENKHQRIQRPRHRITNWRYFCEYLKHFRRWAKLTVLFCCMAFHYYITSPNIYRKALSLEGQALRKLFGGRNQGNPLSYNSL